MDDHHSVYESKIKLPSVFDDPEPDTGLIPINQSDMKILGSATSNKVKFSYVLGCLIFFFLNCCLIKINMFNAFDLNE